MQSGHSHIPAHLATERIDANVMIKLLSQDPEPGQACLDYHRQLSSLHGAGSGLPIVYILTSWPFCCTSCSPVSQSTTGGDADANELYSTTGIASDTSGSAQQRKNLRQMSVCKVLP